MDGPSPVQDRQTIGGDVHDLSQPVHDSGAGLDGSSAIRFVFERVRVALISFHRGGMAHYAAMLSRSLCLGTTGVRVALFVADDFQRDGLPDGVQVFRYPVPHRLAVREARVWCRAPVVLNTFWRDLTRWCPDVVHFNSGHVWYLPLIRRIQRNYATVYTLHDAHPHPGESRWTGWLKRAALLRRADQIIVHSEAIRTQAIQLPGVQSARTTVIPCGLLQLPMPKDQEPAEQANQLVLPGRIYAYKGYEVMLEALPRVAAACPDVRLTIAGEGNLRPWMPAIQQQADRIRVINRFLAEEELVQLMQMASIVVLPYWEASQSGVALLASACGKPVIASRVGALADVVEHGATGLLVSAGRADELADAIIDLLRDPSRRQSMGEAGKALNEQRYGPDAIGPQLRERYERVIQRRPLTCPRLD